MKISIAIPTFNSSRYLGDNLNNLKNIYNISEIIIRDDGSTKEEENKIKKIINIYEKRLNTEIKFYKNKKNLGAFENKLQIISECKEEYVYQIDSDNICRNNFNKFLKEFTLDNLDKNNLYLPSRIYQFRKYKNLSKFASLYNPKYKVVYTNEDFTFDIFKIKESINKERNYLIHKNIRWVLNSGNFIVNKNLYINFIQEGLSISKSILTIDAVAISYLWLKNGGTLRLLNNLYHFHRKRLDSVSFTQKEHYENSIKYLEDKILNI